MKVEWYVSLTLLVIFFGVLTAFLRFKFQFRINSKKGKKILSPLIYLTCILAMCIICLQGLNSELIWFIILFIPCVIGMIIFTYKNTATVDKNERLSKDISITTVSIADAIEELNATNEEIAATTEEIAENSIRVSSTTQNITDMMTVMKKASEQLNLLSLNASIEAARLGEKGLGFGAISDKISLLCKEMTNQVEKSINPLKQTVYLIEEQSSATEEISAATEQLPEATERILQSINRLIELQSGGDK